jgi:hypothetical protein
MHQASESIEARPDDYPSSGGGGSIWCGSTGAVRTTTGRNRELLLGSAPDSSATTHKLEESRIK